MRNHYFADRYVKTTELETLSLDIEHVALDRYLYHVTGPNGGGAAGMTDHDGMATIVATGWRPVAQ